MSKKTAFRTQNRMMPFQLKMTSDIIVESSMLLSPMEVDISRFNYHRLIQKYLGYPIELLLKSLTLSVSVKNEKRKDKKYEVKYDDNTKKNHER